MKEALGLVLLIIFGGWAMNYELATRNYNTESQAVSNLTYRYTQVAGKKGELSTVVYNEFKKKLAIYGDYEITIVAEKFNEDDTITRLENDSVIDLPLRENEFDILTIYVQEKNRHLLSTIFEVSPLGRLESDIHLAAKASVYIQ
jgi:hypothetical protein